MLGLFEQQVRANQAASTDLQQQVIAGERTIIELLNASQELLISRISLVTARLYHYVNDYRVNTAVGRMTATTALNLSAPIYDREQHYNRDAYSVSSLRRLIQAVPVEGKKAFGCAGTILKKFRVPQPDVTAISHPSARSAF